MKAVNNKTAMKLINIYKHSFYGQSTFLNASDKSFQIWMFNANVSDK